MTAPEAVTVATGEGGWYSPEDGYVGQYRFGPPVWHNGWRNGLSGGPAPPPLLTYLPLNIANF